MIDQSKNLQVNINRNSMSNKEPKGLLQMLTTGPPQLNVHKGSGVSVDLGSVRSTTQIINATHESKTSKLSHF